MKKINIIFLIFILISNQISLQACALSPANCLHDQELIQQKMQQEKLKEKIQKNLQHQMSIWSEDLILFAQLHGWFVARDITGDHGLLQELLMGQCRYEDIKNFIIKQGFVEERVTGDHHIFKKPGQAPIVIPKSSKDGYILSNGLANAILKREMNLIEQLLFEKDGKKILVNVHVNEDVIYYQDVLEILKQMQIELDIAPKLIPIKQSAEVKRKERPVKQKEEEKQEEQQEEKPVQSNYQALFEQAFNMSDEDEQLTAFRTAAEYFKKDLSKIERIKIFYNNKGRKSFTEKQYEKALEHYRLALSFGKDSSNKKDDAKIYYNLARVYEELGRVNEPQKKTSDQKSVFLLSHRPGRIEDELESQMQDLLDRAESYEKKDCISELLKLRKYYWTAQENFKKALLLDPNYEKPKQRFLQIENKIKVLNRVIIILEKKINGKWKYYEFLKQESDKDSQLVGQFIQAYEKLKDGDPAVEKEGIKEFEDFLKIKPTVSFKIYEILCTHYNSKAIDTMDILLDESKIEIIFQDFKKAIFYGLKLSPEKIEMPLICESLMEFVRRAGHFYTNKKKYKEAVDIFKRAIDELEQVKRKEPFPKDIEDIYQEFLKNFYICLFNLSTGVLKKVDDNFIFLNAVEQLAQSIRSGSFEEIKSAKEDKKTFRQMKKKFLKKKNMMKQIAELLAQIKQEQLTAHKELSAYENNFEKLVLDRDMLIEKMKQSYRTSLEKYEKIQRLHEEIKKAGIKDEEIIAIALFNQAA